MCDWLKVPAEVSTFMGGSKYPTLTVASLSFNAMLVHFNKYLGVDSQGASSTFSATLHDVQGDASDAFLQYLIKYQDNLKSDFLAPMVPLPEHPDELKVDKELVEIMDQHYYMYTKEAETTNV
ncbi:hypothetical protein R1flu_012431 [Riccia fluitans]|uniref:Uncharacterized protein n=1 Tax=Riccia fluitans TaxID=41844 RepID=A0ABD1ZBR9_9MARC